MSSLKLAVPAAQLSSQLIAGRYGADQAIDGDPTTVFATGDTSTTDQWVSLRVTLSAPIAYIAVYNRNDQYYSWLSPYELWLGNTFGALQHQCGGSLTAGSGLGPFMTWCGGGPSGLQYVTLVLRAGTTRYLAIGELEVYRA